MIWTLTLAAAFIISLWLMVEGAEWLTEGLVRVSITFGIVPFVLGYILNGIDLDNLAVGVVGTLQDLPAVALGTVLGSATFLLTVGVGATAVLVPLQTPAPRRLIVLTLLSPLPFAVLARDGFISRSDGALLLLAAFGLIAYVIRTARTHPLLQTGEKADEAIGPRPLWWAPVRVITATAAIIVGAELFRWSATGLLARLGWNTSWFGMIVVAAAVSFEDVPRMLMPARRGHADISVGHILGTVLFFLLFNAGLIALVRPLPVDGDVLGFYWPAMMLALLLVGIFLWRGRIGRLEGAVLLGLYGLYAVAALAGGYQLMPWRW